MSENRIWNVLDVLKWSETFLREKGLPQPRQDAELLLMAVLNCERIKLYTSFDKPLAALERERYRQFILRRAKHEPVQYITGFCYFMGLKINVTGDVLIPRTDTETLVEIFLSRFSSGNRRGDVTVIDVGTGSGAIAISLAKYLKVAKVLAIDKSVKALEIAKINAENNKVLDKIEFINSDLLEGLIHYDFQGDVYLISNPPYISEREFNLLNKEVRDYEPQQALLAQDEGLFFYRKIVDQATFFGAKLKGVFVEIGYRQAEQVKLIFSEKYHRQPQIVKDLGGNPRVVYTLLE